ncbi:hypothetical protein AB0I69_28080 [Streptomyces sp. NPDC050508]|uniref:hypothetical protein n=1 Tax=Streptomyces sp. NPDC050508 TaxID=3155405 RepID=UPI00341C18A6
MIPTPVPTGVGAAGAHGGERTEVNVLVRVPLVRRISRAEGDAGEAGGPGIRATTHAPWSTAKADP